MKKNNTTTQSIMKGKTRGGFFPNRKRAEAGNATLKYRVYRSPFCKPADYENTAQYQEFYDRAEEKFRGSIRKCGADDLCGDMFDAVIEAAVQQMREEIKMQYRNHCNQIEDMRRLAAGDQIAEESGVNELRKDLAGAEEQLAKYRALQEF